MATYPERFPFWLPNVSSARLWSYLGAGKDHFAEDRELAHRMLEADPTLSHQVEASHRWTAEAVAHMGQAGIRQLLDLGTGYPRDRYPLHARLGRRAHGVYVDRDLTVIAQGRGLNGSFGAVWLDADLQDPQRLLHGPGGLAHQLNPAAPVIVTASLVFQHLDDDQVIELCTALAGLLPAGSRLAVTHHTGELAGEAARVFNTECARWQPDTQWVARTPEQIRDLVAKAGWEWTRVVVPVADQDRRYVDDLHAPDRGGSRLSVGIAAR